MSNCQQEPVQEEMQTIFTISATTCDVIGNSRKPEFDNFMAIDD